jgi:predicted RNase H-like HicB family nuclease
LEEIGHTSIAWQIEYRPNRVDRMSEIIFEVREDETDGGYTAHALGYGIHTQAETLEELRAMVRDAVACYFDESMQAPKIIRLHFVREEVLAA